MKKIISVLLAVCMVFSMTVMAAPMQVTTVQSVQEADSDDSFGANADLMASKLPKTNVKPGINILTGTTSVLNMSNMTTEQLKNIFFYGADTADIEVADFPGESGNKALKWTWKVYDNPSGQEGQAYPELAFDIVDHLPNIVGHSHVHVKYKAAKTVDNPNEKKYTDGDTLWIMHTSGSGGNVVTHSSVAKNSAAVTKDVLVDFLKYNGSGDKATDSKVVQKFRFQGSLFKTNEVPTNVYLDDIAFVPAYQFTYYTPDGNTLLSEEYKAYDNTGNIITSFAPKAGLFGDYYVPAWATSVGGSAVTSVALANENVKFYATDYIPAISFKTEGKLNDKGSKMTLTPVAVPALKDKIPVTKGTWTIEDETVATLTAGKNGSAVITAVNEGTTKATFTAGEVSAEYTVKVVLPYTVEAFDDSVIFDLDTEDYTSMVVSVSGTGSGLLTVMVGENDEFELNIKGNADGSVRDNYFDLTSIKNWVAGSEVSMAIDGNANIESIKLYTAFDAGFDIKIDAPSTYSAQPGEETVFTAAFDSNLRGVYNESVTWSVDDPDDVVSYTLMADGTLLLRSKVGNGVATITATSAEDETVSVSKEIYVNVSANDYGMYHDFLEAKTPADVNLRQCGGDGGNTKLTIENGKLHIQRPVSTSTNGGIEYLNPESSDGSQKWLVIKADEGTQFAKLYYRYDSTGFNETNTTYAASASMTDNEDGTVIWYVPMDKVPETAELITGLMIQFKDPTDGYIHYFYTTNVEPTAAQSRVIGYTWDMKTNKFSTGSGHHFLSTLDTTTGTITVTQAHAVLGSGSSVQVSGTAATLNGKDIWKLTANSGGSVNPTVFPSNLILNDYPYLWIKYKATGSSYVDLYIRDKDQGGATSGYDNKKVQLPESEDYTTLVVYLPELGYKASMNTALDYIMFAYRGTTYLNNVKYDEAGQFYYVEKPVTASSATSITIDEFTFANYNPNEEEVTPLNIGITLTTDKDAITEDSGTLTITPTVFANQPISTYDVAWTLEKGNVKFAENADGSLTVTALANGDVTITASSLEDSSFKESITFSVTGQRNKVATYEFKYYALGNSYLEHGPFNNGVGWPWPDAAKGNRGMAASTYEKDYYHRVQYYLTNGFVSSLTAIRGNYASLERAANYSADAADPIKTYEQAVAAIKANSQYTTIKNKLINEQPNIITVQLSENFGSPYNNDVTRAFYDTVYSMINEYRPEASVVVVMLPFQTGTRPNIIREYATKYGFYIADMTDVPSYSVVDLSRRYYVKDGVTYDRGNDGWKYNPYLAFEQYPEYDEIRQKQKEETGTAPAEFRTHPGDLGMDLIGQRMFEQFEKAVPAFLDAEYIYLPTSLTIDCADEITEKNGSITLTAVAAEDDATNSVVWSIDDTKIATIDQNGVVTAINNGKVTVTATCSYNAEIVATKVITITGQDARFTLSYNKGTTDEVTGIPASDEFAKGEYVLSTVRPERTGYKFLGWSLTENGATVDTVNVTNDVTVYAVWALAENWQLNEDGNDEGVVFSGFNVAVANGQGSVLSYGDGVSVANNSLKLDSDLFATFNVKATLTGSNDAAPTLKLVLSTTEGNKSYTTSFTTLGVLDVYSFDISDAEGTITGFSLVPSASECTFVIDWIELGRVALDEDIKVEALHVINDTVVDLNGNTYEIDVLDASAGITFTNGNVVIGEVTGDGNVITTGANLIYTGDAFEGYVQFNVGEKTAEENLLFAEIDGCQYSFSGSVYGMVVPNGQTKLVQIVEKTSEKAITTVATRYYKVTSDGATELTVLADSIDNVEEVSLRVSEPVGVRFKAGIVNTAKADAIVKEYGFVIALEKDLVNAGAQLNLSFNKIATGSAYISGTDTDVIFENNGTTTLFTGVLYGIPENSYGVKLVSKTFMKLDVDGEEFVVYGEPIAASAYEIAKALENSDELSDSAKAIVDNIIKAAEEGNDVGFDYGDLLAE